jgi:NADH dehydrogenase [ubiquinone] 1 alpha subcomplex assembly factor 6
MQFWRDAVDKALAGTPPDEPVAVMLAAVNEQLQARTNGRSRLSKSWLHRIINTREQYLGNKPYADIAALESYAENTYSTLLYLILSAMPLNSLNADHLASHIGKATGISVVLRGLPLVAFPPNAPTHHPSRSSLGSLGSAPQGTVLLPLDVMSQAGVQEEAVLRDGNSAPNLKDAVFTVATRANDHLITAREMLKNLRSGQEAGHDFEHAGEAEHSYQQQSTSADHKRDEINQAFGVLLQAVSTSSWLQRLEKVDFDIFDRSLLKTDWKLPWKLYWSHKRGQF